MITHKSTQVLSPSCVPVVLQAARRVRAVPADFPGQCDVVFRLRSSQALAAKLCALNHIL